MLRRLLLQIIVLKYFFFFDLYIFFSWKVLLLIIISYFLKGENYGKSIKPIYDDGTKILEIEMNHQIFSEKEEYIIWF